MSAPAHRLGITSIALAMIALATAFGSFERGWFLAREAHDEQRGGYHLLRADFHVHTRASDGVLTPFEVVSTATRRGLDVVALTEHNMLLPGTLAAAYGRAVHGAIVLPGEEITSGRYHLIAVGLRSPIPGDLPVEDAIAQVHAQGGVAIAAHPVRRFHAVYELVLDRLDGMEVVHPIALREATSGWRWSDMVELYEAARARGHHVAPIGSSDYHFFKVLGLCHTLVFARERTAEGVLDAIREARTVVLAPDGRMFGDPELVALVQGAPLPETHAADGYATSPVQYVMRVVGWLGLVGWLALRRVAR